jgi:hypothetical protein
MGSPSERRLCGIHSCGILVNEALSPERVADDLLGAAAIWTIVALGKLFGGFLGEGSIKKSRSPKKSFEFSHVGNERELTIKISFPDARISAPRIN